MPIQLLKKIFAKVSNSDSVNISKKDDSNNNTRKPSRDQLVKVSETGSLDIPKKSEIPPGFYRLEQRITTLENVKNIHKQDISQLKSLRSKFGTLVLGFFLGSGLGVFGSYTYYISTYTNRIATNKDDIHHSQNNITLNTQKLNNIVDDETNLNIQEQKILDNIDSIKEKIKDYKITLDKDHDILIKLTK